VVSHKSGACSNSWSLLCDWVCGLTHYPPPLCCRFLVLDTHLSAAMATPAANGPTVQWAPAPIHTDSGDDAALQRFGHSACVVDARATWGTELCCVFGGVRAAPSATGPSMSQHLAAGHAHGAGLVPSEGGAAATSPPEHHQAATAELLVLATDGADAWFRPRTSGGRPAARAFHSAAVLGRHMYVFGGHVLAPAAGQGGGEGAEGSATGEGANSRKHVGASHHAPQRRHFFNDLWCIDTVGCFLRVRGTNLHANLAVSLILSC
jgi:hypothetical protein